jgi:ribonuclease Y
VNSEAVLIVAIIGCLAAIGTMVALVVLLRRSGGTLTAPAATAGNGSAAPVTSAQGSAAVPTFAPTADSAATGTAGTAGSATTTKAIAAHPGTAPPPAAVATAGLKVPAARLSDEDVARLQAEAATYAAELRATAERDAEAIITKAEAAAAQAGVAAADATAARRDAEDELKGAKEEARRLRADIERREDRLSEREQRVDELSRKSEEQAADLAAKAEQRSAELDARAADLDRLSAQHRAELERVAGLTADQAKAELVAGIESQAKRDAVRIIRDIESEAQKEGGKRARKIVTLAIQRIASEQTSESVVSVLHLPGDEMKGRIIGREGRNIRAFESVTGVNLIIDDTPEAVLLSCFDPVRREVGRLTLERLVLDGRIHPQRIEEAHERSKAEIEALCIRAGEDALVDVGLSDMHPELVNLLGRLRYRTSYGQNVLKHLIESAHIAGMMGSELGMDPLLMKRCTLLHDIGKALTHEVQGSHALIGAEIARKYGEPEDVVHAIEAHHNEVEVRTVEAVLTQAADAISGSRPGARRESLEAYVRRLERLEQIAQSQEGVEKVFAMQAGREIRVMVKPGDIDDIQAQVIARDVAKQVEDELTYPGQIRVTVIRESRAIEFAR